MPNVKRGQWHWRWARGLCAHDAGIERPDLPARLKIPEDGNAIDDRYQEAPVIDPVQAAAAGKVVVAGLDDELRDV